MKILKWVKDNFLFTLTIFLLAFIPLYPKLPLLDVVNTWVYVRAEDFIIVLTVVVSILLLAYFLALGAFWILILLIY